MKARGCLAWSIECAVPGFPDVVGVAPGGKFIAIETKKKGGVVSKVQAGVLAAMEKKGAACAVIASRDQARTFFQHHGLLKPSGGGPRRLEQLGS